MDIAAVNDLNYNEFTDIYGNVIEHCPVLAAAVWSKRPFEDLKALHKAFCGVIGALPYSVKEGVLRCHPDLAGKLAQQGALSSESSNEQKIAGLLDLSPAEKQTLATNNAKYISKFNFPFVICVRENKKEAIMTQIVRREKNSPEQELETGIGEVKKICLLRLSDLLGQNKL